VPDWALRQACRVTFDRLEDAGRGSTSDTLLLASGAGGIEPRRSWQRW